MWDYNSWKMVDAAIMLQSTSGSLWKKISLEILWYLSHSFKAILFTMYKSMQSTSNIRCLLLEKIAENIYQVLKSHFKKARY